MLDVGIFEGWEFNGVANGDAISNLGRKISLPHEYIEFMQKYNGGEGFLGDNYLILWRLEDLLDNNIAYQVDKYAPGIFLFASSGGGEGYGFDMRTTKKNIVGIQFVGMDVDDARALGETFDQFIKDFANANE